MNIIFDKNHHTLMDKERDNCITGKDHWNIARHSQDLAGFDRISPMIRLELQRGAYMGDVWCMCELAREYFRLNDDMLPEALYWWKKAIESKDQGALSDLVSRPIEDRILHYKVKDSEFSIAATQMAMLAGLYLIDLGKTPWNHLSLSEKHERLVKLLNASSNIVGIKEIHLELVQKKELIIGDVVAAGVADVGNGNMMIHESVYKYEKVPDVLQVFFHELGHFISFAAREDSSIGKSVRQRFKVTRERAESYYPYTYKPGYSGSIINTWEEDSDTWGYTVRMIWQSVFCR